MQDHHRDRHDCSKLTVTPHGFWSGKKSSASVHALYENTVHFLTPQQYFYSRHKIHKTTNFYGLVSWQFHIIIIIIRLNKKNFIISLMQFSYQVDKQLQQRVLWHWEI